MLDAVDSCLQGAQDRPFAHRVNRGALVAVMRFFDTTAQFVQAHFNPGWVFVFRHAADAAARHELDEVRALLDFHPHRFPDFVRTIDFNGPLITVGLMAAGGCDAKAAGQNVGTLDDAGPDHVPQGIVNPVFRRAVAQRGHAGEKLAPGVFYRPDDAVGVRCVFHSRRPDTKDLLLPGGQVPALNMDMQVEQAGQQRTAAQIHRLVGRSRLFRVLADPDNPVRFDQHPGIRQRRIVNPVDQGNMVQLGDHKSSAPFARHHVKLFESGNKGTNSPACCRSRSAGRHP